MERILGIDPGKRYTGWAKIEDEKIIAKGTLDGEDWPRSIRQTGQPMSPDIFMRNWAIPLLENIDLIAVEKGRIPYTISVLIGEAQKVNLNVVFLDPKTVYMYFLDERCKDQNRKLKKVLKERLSETGPLTRHEVSALGVALAVADFIKSFR